MRPSELYGVSWPLAAFYLDRGLYLWASFVDRKVNEAEVQTRKQLKKAKNVDVFVNSARMVAFNKLMGLSVASAYRQPGRFDVKKDKPKNVGPQTQTVSGEKDIDWSLFNK